jgi:hypothetical protein
MLSSQTSEALHSLFVLLNPSPQSLRGVQNLGTHKEDPSLKKAQDDLSWKRFMLKEKSAIVFMRNH